MEKAATIHPGMKNYFNGVPDVVNVGEVLMIEGYKRLCFEIRSVSYEQYQHTAQMFLVYRPSPKSRLNNRSVFSKVKMKIVK